MNVIGQNWQKIWALADHRYNHRKMENYSVHRGRCKVNANGPKAELWGTSWQSEKEVL